MASQDTRISKFEANFKQYQGEMTDKIHTFLKAINDRMTGALPSGTVKNPKLNVNHTSSVSYARSYLMKDPQILAHVPIYDALLDKYIESLKLGKSGTTFIQGEMPKKIKDPGLFILPCRLLKIGLLKETKDVLGLADGTKSYPVGIKKNVEVHIGKLRHEEDIHVVDMEKDPTCPLLVGRGFLATASALIDCKKAKIAVGEGITRSIFGVKEINFGEENIPYWKTIGKRDLYTPPPSTDGISARPPYDAKRDFMNHHLPEEWEIARDTELNPFKDILVFRKIVEFLGTIHVNLKGNM
ncbi:MAK10-like protein [Tanacetum coccineum]